MFEAVILAGGMGTRLKSVSGDLPKPMVNVAGTPFLYRLMRQLEASGCSKIVLSLGYRADYVQARVETDQPVKIPVDFAIEHEPLGTGGAIKNAALQISADKFLVLNGDSYSDIDFLEFSRIARNADLLISGVSISEAGRYGTLNLTDEKDVEQLVEKGVTGPGIINSGIYVVRKDEIVGFPSERFSFETDFVRTYKGKFKAQVNDGYFIDIGIPEDYHRACEYFTA